jgi:hypothetical protein
MKHRLQMIQTEYPQDNLLILVTYRLDLTSEKISV